MTALGLKTQFHAALPFQVSFRLIRFKGTRCDSSVKRGTTRVPRDPPPPVSRRKVHGIGIAESRGTSVVAVNVGAWAGGPALGLSVNAATLMGGAGYSAYSRNEQYKAYTGQAPTLGQLTTAVAADMTLVSAGYTVATGEDAFIGVPVSNGERAEIVAHMAIGLAGGYAGRHVATVPRSSGSSQTAGYTFNMVENPGPLAAMKKTPAANFASGKYNMRVLQEDLVIYGDVE